MRTLQQQNEPMALPQALPWSLMLKHWVCWSAGHCLFPSTAGGTSGACWLSLTHRVVGSLDSKQERP